MKPKNLLFLFRRSPTCSPRAKEGLDALLAAAAFEQKIVAVFIDDGVWQLQSDLSLQTLHLPAIDKHLAALPLYGVEQLFVHQASAERRGLSSKLENLCWIDDDQLHTLLNNADQVMTF